MAMVVAENPTVVERSPRSAQQQLAVGSVLGGLYVLAGLWLVLGGLPELWHRVMRNAAGEPVMNEFLSGALLIFIGIVALAGLAYGGYQLLRNNHLHGLRAGIFLAALMLFLSVWIGFSLGSALERQFAAGVGYVVLALIIGALVAGTVFLFLQPAWARFVEGLDEQGWFTAHPYKASQGIRVRRGTVVGVLTLGICGIITLITHHFFGSDRTGGNDWNWIVPFSRTAGTGEDFIRYVPLMFNIHMIMPVVLAGLLLWFAWRLVNVPVFADFLIATEAEMNKVSWTTRRRLVQDTIVVLTTVILLTAFLFFVDLLWIKILSNRYVGVLMYDPKEMQQKQQEKTQW
jgi:preprotein translocase SecE subunit